MSDEAIYLFMSLLALAAGFGGLAYGHWLDRAERTRKILLSTIDRHVRYTDGR